MFVNFLCHILPFISWCKELHVTTILKKLYAKMHKLKNQLVSKNLYNFGEKSREFLCPPPPLSKPYRTRVSANPIFCLFQLSEIFCSYFHYTALPRKNQAMNFCVLFSFLNIDPETTRGAPSLVRLAQLANKRSCSSA